MAKIPTAQESPKLRKGDLESSERLEQNERLYKSLREVNLFVIKDAVHSDPKMFADAIFPVMFPAIKRAISAFFEDTVQSLNRLLDRSFSIQAFRWRLEAWRSGKSFAEIALLHSLFYRVEMVLLIQHQTGFLLDHVATDNTGLVDPEIISSMVTAVQDFIQDTIRQRLPPGSGGTLQFGDYTVWTIQGSKATIAAFFRGHPPPKLREDLQDALHQIQRAYWRELESPSLSQKLSGQTTVFLKECLLGNIQPAQAQPNLARYLPLAIVLLIALLIFGQSHLKTERSYEGFLKLVSNTPGVVVLGHETIPGGKLRIFGLRDRFATDFGILEAKAGVDSSLITHDFKPFISEDPTVLARRIANLLHTPPGIQVRIGDQEQVELIGNAPIDWIQKAKRQLDSLDGWLHYDLSHLVERELLEVRKLGSQIEEQVITFSLGSSHLSPSDERVIQNVVKNLFEIERLLKSIRYSWLIEIQGHTDGTGESTFNFLLSKKRAAVVARKIHKFGFRHENIREKAFGASLFPIDESGKLGTARWVTFKVKLFFY